MAKNNPFENTEEAKGTPKKGPKNNPFEGSLEKTAEEKEIPFTSKKTFPHEKYQTIRIRPDDFRTLKEYAFFNDMTMVDAVSLAIKSLKK